MFESEITALGNTITGIVKSCDGKVLSIAAASQHRLRDSLDAGSTVPAFGEYEPADMAAAQEMYNAIKEATAQAKVAIKSFEASLTRWMTTQPIVADREAVSFALSKSHISPQELRALYDAYCYNYQLASAIEDRAAQMGVSVGEDQEIDLGSAERAADFLIADRYVYPHGSHELATPMTDPSNVSTRVLRALQHLDAFGKPVRHM